jgi:RHS repeat-associated protein
MDNPVAMVNVSGSSETWYYYYADALGSVRLITNASGAVKESYTYDPYGQPRVMHGTSGAGADGNWLTEDAATSTSSMYGNRFMFTGREWDSTTGLYYYRFRDYSPTLGRFLQPDPIGYYDSMNLYQYCGNNPINWMDPLGLFGDGINYAIREGVRDTELGHSDMGKMGYDYTGLDHNLLTRPENLITGTWRHFMTKEETARQLHHDVLNKNATSREQWGDHMHSRQDTFTHKPGILGVIDHVIKSITGRSPDDHVNNPNAFDQAEQDTEDWENLWDMNLNMEDLDNAAEKWAGHNS